MTTDTSSLRMGYCPLHGYGLLVQVNGQWRCQRICARNRAARRQAKAARKEGKA